MKMKPTITVANPLETREKRKPVTPENDPRETGLSVLHDGSALFQPLRLEQGASLWRCRESNPGPNGRKIRRLHA